MILGHNWISLSLSSSKFSLWQLFLLYLTAPFLTAFIVCLHSLLQFLYYLLVQVSYNTKLCIIMKHIKCQRWWNKKCFNRIIYMHCYTFLSDESMFMWLLFDVIIVNYYSSLTYKCLAFRYVVKCQLVFGLKLSYHEIKIVWFFVKTLF